MGQSSKTVRWYLYNLDTDDKFEGQFPPENVIHDLSATFSETSALNRQDPITQFVHGNSEKLSIQGRLFADDSTVNLIQPIRLLRKWTKRDPDLFRPPVLHFWIGDSTVKLDQCLLDSVPGVRYLSFRDDGSPRDILFTINLREYVPYSLIVESGGNTRYHRARDGDYYEWLAQREYGQPMHGVVIRDQNPDQEGKLNINDVVKLPSPAAMRRVVAEPTSIALQTAYGRNVTPQRTLRINTFDEHNRSHTSYVVG